MNACDIDSGFTGTRLMFKVFAQSPIATEPAELRSTTQRRGKTYDLRPLIQDLQMVARANLIFGLHVHVAIEDPEARIQIMNAVRYFLPHVFALSVNSPFWCGRDTGWHSYRAKVFERFPRTGLPDYFGSWGEFDDFLRMLVETGCVDNGKKIWWDVLFLKLTQSQLKRD
jgi:gamma-glutamyl:cysteine ligase YbdK (ATP-grasp superfamily)